MRRAQLAIIALAACLTTPLLADEAEDIRSCLDDNAVAEDRLGACTRLIDAGRLGDEEPAVFLQSRAELHYRTGEYDLARVDLEAAVAIDPTNAVLHSGLGQALLRLKDYGAARVVLAEAVQLDPESYWEHSRLGFALLQLGELDLALAELDRALELNPRSTSTFYYRAFLHVAAGRPDEAITDFTAGLELAPFSDDLYVARGQVYFRAGDAENTLLNYRVANLLNPARIGEQWLQENWPAREVPAAPDPVAWSPPERGTRITYLEVSNEEEPYVDPMQAAIDALAAWFAPPEEPLPFRKHFYTHEIAATEGFITEFIDTDLYGTMDREPVVTRRSAYSLLPASQQLGDLAILERDWEDPVDVLFPLEAGRTAGGHGTFVMNCPEEPQPIAFVVGCLPGVEQVTPGDFTWSATVEGWEDVLLPIGRRMTIKVSYEDTSSITIMGDAVELSYFVTWWYDPEINWWVKRELIERVGGEEQGTITTVEAVAIER